MMAHASRSTSLVVSRCPAARYPDRAAVIAARTWARRPPPRSRAMSAMRTTISPISTAGSTRTAVGETPSTATDAADSSGVTGGWST